MNELSSSPFIDAIHLRIRERASGLVDRGIEPHVAVVLVGEDQQSLTYVGIKEKRSKEDGIILSLYHLNESAPYEEIASTLKFLAGDTEVHGILLQLPLPKQIAPEQVDALINI